MDIKMLDNLRIHHELTYYHSLRVSILCFNLGHYLGLDELSCNIVMRAGLLHDIGKIFIPVSILSYPGKLDSNEFLLIKTHVEEGVILLKEHGYNKEILETINGHHEREDGKGYPSGGTNHHIFSKILAVCDVYDAVREKREYSKALKQGEAIAMMVNGEAGALHMPFVIALSEVVKNNSLTKIS